MKVNDVIQALVEQRDARLDTLKPQAEKEHSLEVAPINLVENKADDITVNIAEGGKIVDSMSNTTFGGEDRIYC